MRDHLQGISFRTVQRVADGHVFGERDILSGEAGRNRMLILPGDLQRQRLTEHFELLDGVRRRQFEVHRHLARRESVVGIGPQRDREQGLEVLDRDALVVLDLHALGAVRCDGKYLRAECG